MLAALSVSALAFAPSALPAVKPGVSRAVAPTASAFDTATAGVPARDEPTQPPHASALQVRSADPDPPTPARSSRAT